MQQPFDPKRDWEALHSEIAGLGEHSSRKSYYPQLRRRLRELEEEIRRRELLEDELYLKNRMLEEEIAHRQQAEQVAANERDYARVIFEAAPVGMMILNESCRVIDANRAMEAISGRKAREILGLIPGQVLNCAFATPESKECEGSAECSHCRLRESVRGVIKSGRARYGIEHHQVRRDGEATTDIWLKISVEPIQMTGEACAIVAVEDISQHRRLQEDLLRTHKLESLGVLAGGIAHDFNNLLTGVMGNLSLALLNEQCDNRHLIRRALHSAEGATELTRQLLTFAKGGAPVKRLVSVVDIVRDTAIFALRGANVACRFQAAEDVWAAEVDVGQLSQVVSNLVINADQAMPAGGVVTISIGNVEFGTPAHNLPAGRYLRICIADRGVGIAPEHRNRIFDPYFTTKKTGSGLGLATVHSIITRHGGHVEIASEEGEGATFTLYLPASDRKVGCAAEAARPLEKGSGRILVMDDEDLIRVLASEMLEVLGYRYSSCENGQQACELYREALLAGDPFNTVVMDLTIPGGMGGVETLKRLREIDPAVRAIVSSGYNSDPVLASYTDYGFLAAVPKPFTVAGMAAALAQVNSKVP